MVTHLNGDWDSTTYLIRLDTLFIKKEYWQTDGSGNQHFVEWHAYRLLSRRADTICMLNPYRGRYTKPDNWTLIGAI